MFYDKKLLIIDDDKDFASLLKAVCELDFKSVDYETNASNSIELFKKLSPDLVICDINIPNINGIKLASIFKLLKIDIEIIYISAYPQYYKNDIDFIPKPFKIDELYSKIKELSN